jgi:ABC-type Na+ efflux pump permease subunit
VVLFVVVLGVSLATRGGGSVRTDPYVVAVQGDLDGARHTLEGLSDRLRFVPSSDAALDSARAADIGIVVPDGLDDRLARHEVVDVVVYETATTADSRAASAFLRAGFGAIHEQAVQAELAAPAAGGDPPSVDHFTLDVVDLQQSAPAARVQAAGLVAAVVLLQATMIVGATGTRLLSRNNRGLLATQLLLPVRRWRLTLAKAVAELQLGVIVAVPILAFAIGFTALTGGGSRGPAGLVAATAVVVATYLVLALAMTTIGVLVGSISRTQEQVSLVSAVVVVVAAIVASQLIGAAVAAPPPFLVVPITGPVSALRGLLDGSVDPIWWIVGCATTVAASALLVRVAARRFDAERLVLRESR